MNQIYTIQKGDSLPGIARQAYDNDSEPYQMVIYRMNQREIGDKTSVIPPGMSLYLPPISNPSPAANTFYIVQTGDTLSGIAQRAYNNGSQPFQMAIYRMNQRAIGGNSSVLPLGVSLWIPPIANPPQINSVYIVQAGDTLSGIAQQTYNSGLALYTTAIYRMNQHTIGNNPNAIHLGDPLYLPLISNPSPAANTFYIVQTGDTLRNIAQRAYNNEKEWTLIRHSAFSEKGSKPGTILFIPFTQKVPGGGNIHPPDNWP